MSQKDIISLLTVAQTGSVMLAADAVGLCPPSVKRCIRALEKVASRIFSMFEVLPARTKARVRRMDVPLAILATSALGTGRVLRTIASWPEAERQKDIHLTRAAPDAAAQDLRSGKARIGFASFLREVPGITAKRVFGALLVVAMPGSRIAGFSSQPHQSLSDAVGAPRLPCRIKQTPDRLIPQVRRLNDDASSKTKTDHD